MTNLNESLALCVACEAQPNCDNSWCKSGLCRECLYASRGERCRECYNSPLYCVCDDGLEKRRKLRAELEVKDAEALCQAAEKVIKGGGDGNRAE